VLSEPVTVPEDQLFIKKLNSGDGHYSCGWVFRPELEFDEQKLQVALYGLQATRIKGVFKVAPNRSLILNAEEGSFTVNDTPVSHDSRVEIISSEPVAESLWINIESQLILAIKELG
jgi:hypothetical protein